MKDIKNEQKLMKKADATLNEAQMEGVSGGGGLFGATGLELDLENKMGDLEGNELKFFSVDKTVSTIEQKTSGKNNQVQNTGGIQYYRA